MSYVNWRIVTYRLVGEGSRHRVGVWRELRRVGAVALQSATWAIPGGDGFDVGLQKAVELVERSGGQALVLDVDPASESLGALEQLYTAEREAEWVEFVSECLKATAELQGEIEKQKFTLAELDEEEHSADRLRRWYRDLRARDLFGAASAAEGETRLKEVLVLLEDFADRVYRARQQS